MTKQEEQAREAIDKLLQEAGWDMCDASEVNLSSARCIAIRDRSAIKLFSIENDSNGSLFDAVFRWVGDVRFRTEVNKS